MNSDLYNNTAVLPDTLLKHLGDSFNSVQLQADTNIEGFNRNQELRQSKNATYQQIKRIKSWFDGYNGNKEDAPFILNGENKMKDFVNSILSGARQSLSTSQTIRNNTGMQMDRDYTPNANVNLNLSQDTANKSNLEKYNLQVTESLKMINEIMTKL